MSKKAATWTLVSNVWYQRILSVGLILLGVVFITNSNYSMHWDYERSAYLLGWLIAVVGWASLVVCSKEVTVVDSSKRMVIVRENLYGRLKEHAIPFGAIARITVGRLGRPSSGVNFYHIEIMLRNNQKVTLLSPGKFYPGCFDRNQIEKYRTRLDTMVNAD